MKTKNKLMSLAGFTLVELLIVMLIVAILAIAMLPMYKKYMCKAKYTAEGLPILATIKTQVDLDIYDKSYAPGVPGYVYTWKQTETGFKPVYYPLDTQKVSPSNYNDQDAEVLGKHIRRLIKEGDLQGKLIRPNHVFYCCINPGRAKSDNATLQDQTGGDYAYAIGVFGDGTGLPQNSGVATMEVRLGSLNVTDGEEGNTGATILATWENFDGAGLESVSDDQGSENSTYGQIRFALLSDDHTLGACEIPNKGMVDGWNSSEMTLGKLREPFIELEENAPCGEWTFQDYTMFDKQ